MAEVSNGALALVVLAALAVVTAGTLFNMQSARDFTLTGMATSDTGVVNLTINSTLAIQVASAYNNITFGSCAPRAGASYWCASNDTAVCSGNNALGNCSLDTTTPQYIRVDNVGNVAASVNVSSECTAATIIGGTSPLFQYATTACNGTNVTNWTNFTTTAAGTLACNNLSIGSGQMQLYINVTIPNDATGGTGGGCNDNQATLTFTAVTA